jgi:hypothetical protein
MTGRTRSWYLKTAGCKVLLSWKAKAPLEHEKASLVLLGYDILVLEAQMNRGIDLDEWLMVRSLTG